ncbi:unnamed protein product [Paramecium sonneborni]|uniref:Uncharacterized protein n=1 Tax=Paramecium sonneborni TaxID=65129 RepID=A0A8S1RPU8_9CILI|nr:unnamed protein product [Paramecium sonneborni]
MVIQVKSLNLQDHPLYQKLVKQYSYVFNLMFNTFATITDTKKSESSIDQDFFQNLFAQLI